MSVFEHNHRARIYNPAQHPYKHTLEDFSFTHPALPGITDLNAALEWIFAVLYPNTKDPVATKEDLPTTGNAIGDYRIVTDDGDGKAAGYQWQQREGDATPRWYKVADMDWGVSTILSQFLLKTQDVYAYRYGHDDLDADGNVVTGDLAGQSLYGGASANTNLILYANSGDGTGPNTGFVQFGDNTRPLADSAFTLGTDAYRFLNVFTDEARVGTLTLSAGSLSDSGGTINFGATHLTTTGNLTAASGVYGTLTVSAASIVDSSGMISFGANALTTTGSITSGTLSIGSGSIADTSGEISFGVTDLVTTGIGGFGSLSAGELDIDNINIDNNTISSTNLNGNIIFLANGLGIIDVQSPMTTVDQDVAGTLDITGDFYVDNIYINGNTISSDNVDGNIVLDPNGAGVVSVGSHLNPATSASHDLGATTFLWKDLYLSAGISNGTTSISISDLLTFGNVGTPGIGDALFWDGSKWVASTPDTEIDHGTISGLGDDDHTQYALLAGRSGGQEIIGGTAANNNLTLESTSNATKGRVLTKSDFAAHADATYSVSWSGVDVGASGNRFRHVYTAGEFYGFRLENVSANPTTSSQRPGRLFWNTVDERVRVDTGTEIKDVGGIRFEEDTSWDGSTAVKNVDVSGSGIDATKAIWQLRDNTNNFEIIYPVIEATTVGNVRITANINLTAGSYRLVGLQ